MTNTQACRVHLRTSHTLKTKSFTSVTLMSLDDKSLSFLNNRLNSRI